MKCPVCNIELKVSKRQGVIIDYCPKCHGIWLNRGELDKIIDRVAATGFRREADDRAERYRYEDKYENKYEDMYEDMYEGGRVTRRKKRKSFLGELLDL